MKSPGLTAVILGLLFFVSGESTRALPSDQLARIRELAIAQADQASGWWSKGQRDCAGFVRFLYREAVTGRARMWKNRSGELVDYVGADELVAYNFDPLSRIPDEKIRSGDLLVFYSPHRKPAESWHLMVVLDPPPGATRRPLVIYHNGSTGKDAAVRKVWLDDLIESPATQWRPLGSNRRFIGVFRWKGWASLP